MKQYPETFTVNSLGRTKTGKMLLFVMTVPMMTMFVLGATAVPPIITTAVFIALIAYFIMGFLYRATYSIYEDRLEEVLVPRYFKSRFNKPSETIFYWKDLDEYIFDSDMKRGGSEAFFIKFRFSVPDVTVRINQGDDREAFLVFCNAFRELAEGTKTANASSDFETVSGVSQPSPLIHAKAGKSYYGTFWAKFFAVLFLACSVAAILWSMYAKEQGKDLGFLNNYRIWFVLIPGTIYMVSRAFFSNKKQS